MRSPRQRCLIPALLMITLVGCQRQPTLTDEAYREAVVAFHTGVAAMQTSQEVLAREQLDRVTQLADHEPAAWANLGLLLLRQQELEPALQRLQRAEVLAPEHAGIQRLLALAAGRLGDLSTAVGHWRKALAAEPDDPQAAYALALDLERAGGDDNENAALLAIDALATLTGNLAAQVEFARLAAKRSDAASLQRAVAALDAQAPAWPDDIRERFATVKAAATADPASAGRPIAFLKNFMLRLPAFRQAVAKVSTPREEVGEPLYAFVVLPNPVPRAAEADAAMTFATSPVASLADAQSLWTGALSLTGEGAPQIAVFDGQALRLARAADAAAVAVAVSGDAEVGASGVSVVGLDLDYDFRTDLVVTGAAGTRILRQTETGGFVDVSAETALPAEVLARASTGAWAADVDLDGDLDTVLGFAQDAPVVLRNNGDGTFAVIEPFGDLADLRDLVWLDVDGDGVPDAVLLHGDGRVRLLVNERSGSFRERPAPDGLAPIVAIAVADVSGDPLMDVVALARDGAILRIGLDETRERTTSSVLGRVDMSGGGPGESASSNQTRLLIGDLDNNGALDLVVAAADGARVLLGNADRSLSPLAAPIPLRVTTLADVNEDGRLELVGTGMNGRAAIATSTGTKAYHWQMVRPRAATAFGDQRINSFGIGGEVEVRTGLHLQKRLITSPLVHVGLGDATRAEVVRVLWPNGTLQSEFGFEGDRVVEATQRLKGSCPWLFAWNGREMGFVTDVLWRSPLGLRINALDTADVLMTEDRVKVRGDQLVAREGHYELRITAELWETHFFDLVSLLVVDHPDDTEVWVDERFAVPAPSNEIVVTGPVQPLSAAHDDAGRDVLDIVQMRDDRHLDFAGRGRYQGITRDHFVEIELPDTTSRTGPVWLIAQGWIHPTDSSINVAISQGQHATPKGIAIQLADASGAFHTIAPNIGFPAGKDKTILFDLAPYLPASGAIRLRLATNLEIFWDRIGWARGRPEIVVAPTRLLPRTAELRYRGYSATVQANATAPERPRYEIEGTTSRWLDLEGYHTRFGDVRPLIVDVDDRYVIMNAGDELQVRFPEAGPVVTGQRRDFIVVSDGWEKDGDFNTTYSRTVLPLPTHDTGRYDRAPGRLEDDPVFLKHPQDFADYHTRYVTPSLAREALRTPASTRRQTP